MFLGINNSIQKVIDEQYDPNGRFGGDSFLGDVVEHVEEGLSSIGQGLKNWWYKLTGQTEKTSAYQAQVERENELIQRQEEREDTAYQRASLDMEKAGLSKYLGVSPASSGSYRTGVDGKSDPIGQLSALQNLQANALAINEHRYNLKKSEELGIRTGDSNYVAKWASLANVLFGFDPSSVEGGVIPYIYHLLTDKKSQDNGGMSGDDYMSQFSSPDVPFSEALQGATIDQIKSVASTLKKVQSLDDKQKSQLMSDLISSVSSGLPKSLTSQVDKGLSTDIKFLVSQMKTKPYDDYTIERLADFLSSKYHESKESIIKRIKDSL